MDRGLRPALFLDRDGVINEEIGYLHRFEDVRFVDGAADLVRTANRLRMPVVVITNQAGIGRGLYSEAQFHALMSAMRGALATQGAQVDAVYYSPFHPEHGIGEYQRDTECRKPKPGMLLQAAAEHGIDLAASVLVGDRCSDVQAGAAAGLSQLFLVAGTEREGCAGVSHTPVARLTEVTLWLERHFAGVEVTVETRDNAVAS